MAAYISSGLIALALGLLLGVLMLTWVMISNEKRHRDERKDLYNRIMADSLHDLSILNGKQQPTRARNFVTAGLKQSNNQLSGFKTDE